MNIEHAISAARSKPDRGSIDQTASACRGRYKEVKKEKIDRPKIELFFIQLLRRYR